MQKIKLAKTKNLKIMGSSVGLLAAMLVTLFLSAIAGIFIQNEYINMDTLTVMTKIIQGLSVLVGALIAGVLIPEKKIISCVVIGMVYYLVLAGCSLLLFDGLNSGAISSLLSCATAVFLAVLLCTKGKRRTHTTKIRKRYC